MNDVVKSISLENLTNQRGSVVDKLEAGLRLLQEAAQLASFAGIGFPSLEIVMGGRRNSSCTLSADKNFDILDLLDACRKTVDAGAWRQLMNESGLRTFMDAATREEWDEKIYELDVPPLTMENIRATFTALHAAREDMFEKGVINLFRSLSFDYKTNKPFKFGKRLIVTGLFRVYASGGNRWLTVDSSTADKLDDLDRVFHILDGKPEPDHRQGWSCRVSSAQAKHEQEIESTYFDVKWFLNGNAHLVFKQGDLITRMNLILAKHYPQSIACER